MKIMDKKQKILVLGATGNLGAYSAVALEMLALMSLLLGKENLTAVFLPI